jgi:DNA-binding beta-propeller fold protein YncE
MSLRGWLASAVMAVVTALAVVVGVVLVVGPPDADGLFGIGAAARGEAGPVAAPVPRTLSVSTKPAGAALQVTGGDGKVTDGRTPFTGTVTGGVVTLAMTRAGANPLTERINLDGDRSLEFWLDPAGSLHHKLGEAATASAPRMVTWSPDGRELWVPQAGSPAIEVFDSGTLSRLGEVRLSGQGGAVEVVFAPDGATAYVSQLETGTVYAVDRSSRKVTKKLATGGRGTRGLTLSPDGRTLFAANWDSADVSEINLSAWRVLRLFRTVATPRGLFVGKDGGTLYVAGFTAGWVERIDLTEGSRTTVLRTGSNLRDLVGDPSRGLLYADDPARNQVLVLDLGTGESRQLARTDVRPESMALSSDGKVLYVANRGRDRSIGGLGPTWGSVLALDTTTGKPLDAIVGGDDTNGIALSPDHGRLAFTDNLDNRVQVYTVPGLAALSGGNGGRYEASRDDLRK